jgi:hypothetical protein
MMKMKKKTLTLLPMLCAAFAANAQSNSGTGSSTWVVSGSDIYYSPNPDTIKVGAVSYSDENGGPSSTCGNYVQNQCNGKTSCAYTGSDATCGFTSPQGQKNYLFVNYTCGGISYSKQIEAGVAAKIACPGVGNVGIGTETPEVKLDVKGEVKFGNSSSSCNLTNEAQQRYNSNSHVMEYCDGKTWTAYLTDASLKNLQSQVDALKAQIETLNAQIKLANSIINNIGSRMPPCKATGMISITDTAYPNGVPVVLCVGPM